MTDEDHGWGPALEEIERRKTQTLAMGGEARLVRQSERGRLNARERIAALFDPDSFSEIGQLVGTTEDPPVPGDALVAGSGLVDGRPVLAGAEDVTVLGGSIGSGASDKRFRLCQLALQERVPLVMMLEGAGHRVTDSATGRRPGDLMGLAELSGIVPIVCLVLGASAGHGALTAPLSDFAVMTESSSIFAAGPPLVKSATGEDVTKEVLGGPQVAADGSGVVHNVVADDREAISLARRYLGLFPAQRLGDAAPSRRDPTPVPADWTHLGPHSRQPSPSLSDYPCPPHAGRRGVSPRDSADVRTLNRHRAGCSWRAERGHRGQRSWRDGRHSGQCGRRQGCAFSRRRRGIRTSVRVSGRQSRSIGGHLGGAARDLASCRTDVRRSAPADSAEAARYPAQGVRFRLIDHGHESVRWPDDHPGFPVHHARRSAGEF